MNYSVKKRYQGLSLALCFIFVFTLFFQSISFAPVQAASSLLANGSFESVTNGIPNGWVSKSYSGGAVMSVTNEVYKDGSKSLKIDATVSGRTGVYQSFVIVPNQSYKFSGWIKTDNVVSANGARVRLYFIDNAWNTVSSLFYTDGLKGTNDWTYKEMIVTAPANATKMVVENMPDAGTGITWFDNETVQPWVSVDGITINPKTASLAIGQSLPVTAIVQPENATNKTVLWTSSNPNVVSVDNGVITAKSLGNATISATTADGGKSDQCFILVGVPFVGVTGVTLNQTAVNAAIGDRITLVPQITPADATITSVQWESSNSAVASVVNGAVMAVSKGTAVITCRTTDGNKVALSVINVCNVVKNSSFEMIQSGASLPDNWKLWTLGTQDPSLFQVSVSGSVYKNESKSLQITVGPNASGSVYQTVSVTGGGIYKFSAWVKTEVPLLSDSSRFTIAMKDADGAKVASDTYVTIPGIQMENGWMYIEKMLTIPTSAQQLTLSCAPVAGSGTTWFDSLTIQEWVPVTGITLDQSDIVVSQNSTTTLHAQVLPAGAVEKNIKWTSSQPSVASVDNTGNVMGLNKGLAVITAETEEGSFKVFCVVQVGTSSTLSVGNYTATTEYVTAVSGKVTASSTGAQTLTYSKLLEPAHGILSVNSDGSWTYTPDFSFSGEDLFKIAVTDNNNNFAYAKVQVNVKSLADLLVPFQNVHPRLYLDAEEVSRLKAAIAPGGTHAALWQDYKAIIDNQLIDPPVYFEDKDAGELWQRGVAGKTIDFAFAYVLTGEQKYLDYATKWALASCSYPTWGKGADENVDLPAGHQLLSLAIVYDWLNENLDATTKATIFNKLKDRGEEMYLKASGQAYKGNYFHVYWVDTYLQNHLWVNLAGLSAAALAIYDENNTNTIPWLEFATNKFDRIEKALGDDGASQEGYPYWQYGAEYLIKYSKLSEKFFSINLMENEWLKHNAKYATYMTLPKDSWTNTRSVINFADSPDGNWYGPDYIFRVLASEYKDGTAQWMANRVDEANIEMPGAKWLGMISYDPSVQEVSPATALPTMYRFEDMDIAISRSDWSGSESVVAFRSGPFSGHREMALNTASPYVDWGGGHVHPDVNHFVVFGNGEWLIRDDGYADKLTSNHNTLLVDGKGQMGEGSRWFQSQFPHAAKAEPSILNTISTADFDYMAGDGTEAYDAASTGLNKYVRHLIYLKPNILIVADDIEVNSPKNLELRFFPEAQNALALSSQRYLTISTNSLLKFQPLTPENASIKAEWVAYKNDASTATSRMAYRVTNNTQTKWRNAVAFSWSGQQMIPLNVNLSKNGDKWKFEVEGKAVELDFLSNSVRSVAASDVPAGDKVPLLDAILVNGKALPGFEPSKLNYHIVKTDSRFDTQIMAIRQDSDAKVNISYDDKVPGKAIIEVESKTGVYKTTYTVMLASSDVVPVLNIESNGTAGFAPINTVDDDMQTIWSARIDTIGIKDNPYGYAWLKADLGERKLLDKISIAWYFGTQRKAYFDIDVSEDGISWNRVYSGESSGTSDDYEVYNFPDVQARYVKVWTRGTSTSVYSSIKEMKFYRIIEPVTALSLDKTAVSLCKGEITAITANVLPANATDKKVFWTSSNPAVVTVDDNGVVTAIAPGVAAITATTPDGVFTASCDVEVVAGKRVWTKMLDSTGKGTAGGQVTAYIGGQWRSVGVTDENGLVGFAVAENTANLTVGVKYEGTYKNVTQNISANNTVTFSTVPVSVSVKDSAGNGLAGSAVSYYADGWKNLGTTNAEGNATKELLPGRYNFQAQYEGTIKSITQDTGIDATVEFNTIHVVVSLKDSTGNGLGGGAVSYYAGGWKSLGTTDTEGNATKELLPGRYTFQVQYAGTVKEVIQDTGTDATVEFSTVNVAVRLLDSAGNGLEGGTVSYYANGWKTIGVTDAQGYVYKDLLPGQYKFQVQYQGVTRSVVQDTGVNPLIAFTA